MNGIHNCCYVFLQRVTLLHGFAGTGFLHPLTGLDRMLAMIAVGAWSAQLGGRNLVRVPLAFLLAMCVGGILGIYAIPIQYTEAGIALSVFLLGAAIALNQRKGWVIAVIGVGMFGLCHGYAHGAALPKQEQAAFYVTGFIITTLGLHFLGAVAGLLLLEEETGERYLRLCGVVVSLIGLVLLADLKSLFWVY